jgi:hypothetical protein
MSITFIFTSFALKYDESQRPSVGCSFTFILKVGIEESIVNAPLVSLHSKNTKNAKSEVRF